MSRASTDTTSVANTDTASVASTSTASVAACLAARTAGTLVIRCRRGEVSVAELQAALAAQRSARSLCAALFADAQNTTPLHTLFACAGADVLDWLVATLPLDLLCTYGPAPAGGMTVLHVLAVRPRDGGIVDAVYDEFTPRFMASQARTDAMAQLDSANHTPLQLLAAAGHRPGYDAVQSALAAAGARETPEQMMLERARHDLARARHETDALRVRVASAERTTAELRERYETLERSISTRTDAVAQLRAETSELAAEAAALREREEQLLVEQTRATAAAAVADEQRRAQETLVKRERGARTQLGERAAAAEHEAAELKTRVDELAAVAAAAEQRAVDEEAARVALVDTLAALQAELAAGAERRDDETTELARRVAEAEAQTAAATERAAQAEATRKHTVAQKRTIALEHSQAKTALIELRAERDAATRQTQLLEERLEELSASQADNERRCALLRTQLAAINAEHETSESAHAHSVELLRAANERLTVELDDARRIQRAALEAAERERVAAAAATAAAHRQAAEDNERSTAAAQTLADVEARAAAVAAAETEYCTRVTELNETARAIELQAATRIREMADRVEASERAAADAQSNLATRLEASEGALAAAHRALADEKAAQSELGRRNRELNERVATLSAPLPAVSPKLARPTSGPRKARPTGSAPEPPEEPTTPRGALTPRGKTMLKRAQSIRGTLRASGAIGGAAAGDDADSAAIAQIAQGVGEDDETLALATYKLNEPLWIGLRDAVQRADVGHVGALFRLGLSANTRDPQTRRTMLETAVRASADVSAAAAVLSDDAKQLAIRIVALIDLVLRNGGEWDGLDQYVRAASAHRLAPAVVEKLRTRDDIAPFCCAVLADDPERVERYIADVGDLDRVPAHGSDKGYAYLHLAVVRASPRVVYLLVLHGADVTLGDSRGRTPLHLALAKIKQPAERLAVVEYLLAGGAEPSAQSGVVAAGSSDEEGGGAGGGARTARRRLFGRLRGRAVAKPGGPPNLASGDNTTPLAMAQALGDLGILRLLNGPRFHRVTVAKMREYVERAVSLHTTVERMLASSPPLLRADGETDTDYRLFSLYGQIFHSFNPHFVAAHGEVYTTRRLRVAADVHDAEVGEPREQEKVNRMRGAHQSYVGAALAALAAENKTASNASLRWELLKNLEACIYAVDQGWFEVSELIRRPARELYDEAALRVLASRIADDDQAFVAYMVGRRDRLFGPLFEVDSIVDHERDLTGVELAAASGSVAVLAWYLEKLPARAPDAANDRGQTLVSLACDAQQPLAVVALDYHTCHQRRADDPHPHACHYGMVTRKSRSTALHLAVNKGADALLAFCIDQIPRHVRSNNERGQTAFDIAVMLLKAPSMPPARRGAVQNCLDALAKAALASTGVPLVERRPSSDDEADPAALVAPPTLELPPGTRAVDDTTMLDALSDPE